MTHEYLLPPPGYQQRKLRVRTLLGHCLYRRVILWTVTLLLLLLCLTAYGSGRLVRESTGGMLDFVELRKGEYWGGVVGVKKLADVPGTLVAQGDGDGDGPALQTATESEQTPSNWLKYRQ